MFAQSDITERDLVVLALLQTMTYIALFGFCCVLQAIVIAVCMAVGWMEHCSLFWRAWAIYGLFALNIMQAMRMWRFVLRIASRSAPKEE